MVGLGYGVILSVLAFWATGAGHGTYIPLGLSSAPSGFLGIIAALVAIPVLWALLGGMVASGRGGHARIARAVVLLHYVTGALLLAFTDFGDRAKLGYVWSEAPSMIASWALVYLAGQVVLWWRLSKGLNLAQTV